jgi:hypothetical protein
VGSNAAQDALIARAVAEVDESLLDWYRGLSVVERLRAASRSAAVLERMARAASTHR